MTRTGELFYGTRALQACADAGCDPLTMPLLAQTRMGAPRYGFVAQRPHDEHLIMGGAVTSGPQYAPLWQNCLLSASAKITGTTKGGTPVVIYAHEPTGILNAHGDGNKNGLVQVAQEDFNTLLDKDGNGNIFVVGHGTLRRSPSGILTLEEAMRHPQTIPFFCLGRGGAQAYLERMMDVYGTNSVIMQHTDDLGDNPQGRLLFLYKNYCGAWDGQDLSCTVVGAKKI